MEDIYQEIEQSFLDNRDRLIKFFQKHGFEESQAEELTGYLKNATYFLDIKKLKRPKKKFRRRTRGVAILYPRKKDLKEEKQSLENLMDEISTLKKVYPDLDLSKLLTHWLVNNIDPVNKQRVSINQPLVISLFALFWALKRIGYGQKQQVDLVYDLFVMFKVDDYGKGSKKYDSPKGELSEAEVKQHERIRIRYQQPAMQAHKDFALEFGWDA